MTALGSLLGFLHVTGPTGEPLAPAVPTVVSRRLAALDQCSDAETRELLSRLTPGNRRLLVTALGNIQQIVADAHDPTQQPGRRAHDRTS